MNVRFFGPDGILIYPAVIVSGLSLQSDCTESIKRALALTLLSAGIAAGCSRDSAEQSFLRLDPTALDLADVSTVSLSAEQLNAAPRWQISAEPLPDSIPIPRVGQIYDAPILSNRVVAVVTRRAEPGGQVHFYGDDTAGVQRVVDLPHRSDGATLYGDVNLFAIGSDVLLAGSRPGSRSKSLWVVRSDSSVVEAATMPTEWESVVGVLGDTSLVVRTKAGREPEQTRASYLFSLVLVPHQSWTPPGEFHGRTDTLLTLAVPTDPQTGLTLLWGHVPDITVGTDRIWVVPTDAPEIIALSARGEPLLRIGWEAGDRSVPTSAFEHWRSLRIADAESTYSRDAERRSAAIAGVRASKPAARHPAVLSVHLGGRDRLFVRRYTTIGGMPQADSSLLVLRDDGALIARLQLPGDLRVAGFGHDYVLARASTANGEYLVRYSIGIVRDQPN